MSLSNASRLRRIAPGFLFAPMTPRRTWWFAFTVFCLLGAAWSLAMPYDGPADELQHVLRAYGVWSGQIHLTADLIRVPQSLVPQGLGVSSSCFRWNHTVSAHCAATAGANKAQIHQMIMSPSNAATYSPVYYALVGWTIRIWPTDFGIILARLLTTVFMSVFIASAIAIVAKVKYGRWLLAGMLLVLTPVVVNLEGGVNPAGPEIVVGLALWAALIGMVDADKASPALVRLACISAGFLAVFRSFGLGWLALILVAGAFGLTRPQLRRLLADRSLRRTFWRWSPFSLVGVIFGYYWDHLSGGVGNLAAGPVVATMSQSQADLAELWTRSTYYTQGLIALTSYGDVPTPELVFYFWFGACALLILLALAVCGWRDRLRIVGVITASYAILMYPDSETVMHGWWLSQGRYALPFIVGAPLLSAYLLGKHEVLAAVHLRKVIRMLGLLLLPIQLGMLIVTMIRFQSGGKHIDFLHGAWLPPLGPELPLVLCCAGIAVAWFMVCRLTPLDAASAEGSEPEVAGPGVIEAGAEEDSAAVEGSNAEPDGVEAGDEAGAGIGAGAGAGIPAQSAAEQSAVHAPAGA
jgi:hypothetical protein